MWDMLHLESLSIPALFPALPPPFAFIKNLQELEMRGDMSRALFIPIYPPCRTAIVFDYL